MDDKTRRLITNLEKRIAQLERIVHEMAYNPWVGSKTMQKIVKKHLGDFHAQN